MRQTCESRRRRVVVAIMRDTLTGERARLADIARDWRSPLTRSRRACSVRVRVRLRMRARVRARYRRADRMTDGRTPRATESGDSRDTSSHSPTHYFQARESTILSLSLSSAGRTLFSLPPFGPLSLLPNRCTLYRWTRMPG